MQQIFECPNCHALVTYGQNTCNNCGIALDWGFDQATYSESNVVWDQQIYECPHCREPVAYGQDACTNCNVALDWGSAQRSTETGEPQSRGATVTGKITTKPKKKRLSPAVLAVMSLIFVALAAGGITLALKGDSKSTAVTSDNQTAASTAKAFDKPPAIKIFKAEPATITLGQKTTLSWDISEATSVTIEPGFGTVSSSGTKVVSPDKNTTFYLTASNNAGPVKASIIVTVKEPPEPAITSFSVSPGSISAGESANLQWSTARATYISIDQGIGVVMASGKQPVNPTINTTYTITATNGYGSVKKSVTLTVAASKAPVISSFTASPATISISDNSTLKWDVSGATSISIDPGIGSVLATGTTIVSPTETTTYNLTARNSAGSVSKSATVTIASNLPTITSFTSSSSSITAGSAVTLQWSIDGATSASIDHGIGTVSTTSGSVTITPSGTATYILTATNSYGSVKRSVPVVVVSTNPPNIVSFTADSLNITAGSSTTLRWDISGATSASIAPGFPDLSLYYASRSVQVSPAVNTLYTLTAANSNGTVTATLTITVTSP